MSVQVQACLINCVAESCLTVTVVVSATCIFLQEIASALSSSLAEGKVEHRQACFRPYAPDGVPVIGPIPGVKNVYVASGHGCWGIANSAATGEAVAQLVAGTTPLLNLKAFDPGRFPPQAYRNI